MTRCESYTVNSIDPSILDNFNDLVKYGELHPLMYKVERLSDQLFKIYERPIKGLPIPITYKAKVIQKPNKSLFHIQGLPYKKVELMYSFDSAENTTHVDLCITVEGLLFGKKYLLNKMFHAQRMLIENLNKSLDS